MWARISLRHLLDLLGKRPQRKELWEIV